MISLVYNVALLCYCRWLRISRQGGYKFLNKSERPWKHTAVTQEIRDIIAEDEWNDNYGKNCILEALQLKQLNGDLPSITTIYRIMKKMGIIRKPKKKPNGITKADISARKSDDLLQRNFFADAHNKHPELHGANIHSDRGSQYTSHDYRVAMKRHCFIQSMNSDGGRCHDNARYESMWAE